MKEVNALVRHLKSKPIFELASESGLDVLIQRSRVISFAKSTPLLETGHEHLFLYLVLSGQVEMRCAWGRPSAALSASSISKISDGDKKVK